MSPLIPLRDADGWRSALERSRGQPVVIFKHSPSCGTSARALRQVEALLRDTPGVAAYLVRVIEERPLSQRIAADLGVRHASPQALVVSAGKVRWHASHGRVTADRLRQALDATS